MIAKKKNCSGCDSLQYIWRNEAGRRYCKKCASKSTQKTKPPTDKKRYVIPARSSKKEKEDAIYKVLRLAYLKAHPTCAMNYAGICLKIATTIQHLRGRCGGYYLDQRYFMSACLPCHQRADTAPKEALELGFAQLRLKNYEDEK